MPSPYIIGKTTVNVEEVIFDYKEFYRLLNKTISEKGYAIEEKSYSYIPGIPGERGKLSFFWLCLKDVDDYSRYRVEVDASFDIEQITVLKNNKKIDTGKGTGKVIVRATLVTDYDSKWEENPIINFLKVLFENWFERSSMLKYLNDIKTEMYEIENEIKGYFNVQRMM